MNRKALILFVGIAVLLFVVFPDDVSQGAKLGLNLWFFTVLPALLPFMILSAFMIRQNITDCISRMVYPVLHRIFGLSKRGCYPAVIGLLSGYPLGAKTAAQLYGQGMIERKEAQYLLSFCNNASPMFLLEYIAISCMSSDYPLMVLFLNIFSAFLGSLFSRRRMKGRGTGFCRGKKAHSVSDCMCGEDVGAGEGRQSVICALDDSILDAFVTITKIGGYIILFSIFNQMLDALLPISAIMKGVGIGIMEITTGSAYLSRLVIPSRLKNSLLAALCAFGGLCSVFQTASVISDTDLSVGEYLRDKVRQMVIAGALGYLWFGMM